MPEHHEQQHLLTEKLAEFKNIVLREGGEVVGDNKHTDVGNQVYDLLMESKNFYGEDFGNELLKEISNYLEDLTDVKDEYPEIDEALEALETYAKEH